MNVMVLCSKQSTKTEILAAEGKLPVRCSWNFFFDASECEKYVQKYRPAAVFIDCDIRGEDPYELLEKLKESCPGMSVVFLVEKDAYIRMGGFFAGCYFINHPIDLFTLADTLERIYKVSANVRRRIEVRMFGSFDIFVNGQVVEFSNKKVKELLALCFDQEGGVVSMEMAVDALWGDRPYDDKVKGSYRKATMNCANLLEKYGIGDIFHKERATTWVDTSEVFCDYYRFLQGDRWFIAKLVSTNYYLYQYDWALVRHPALERLHKHYLECYGMASGTVDMDKYKKE